MSDVAWVIGHGGIGSAVARRLGRDHRVTTFDRRAGADVPVNLNDAAATVDALRRAAAPAVVVVAAGTVSPVEPGGDPDDIGRVIDDNLAALVTLLGVLGDLPPLRCAVIVSNAALVARPRQPVYAATKAAAVSLIRSSAQAWGPRGSRIYGIAPGTVVVPRNADALAARFPELPLAADRPGGRIALPDDLAEFVAATLPFADFLTGHSLPFDAGSSLG